MWEMSDDDALDEFKIQVIGDLDSIKTRLDKKEIYEICWSCEKDWDGKGKYCSYCGKTFPTFKPKVSKKEKKGNPYKLVDEAVVLWGEPLRKSKLKVSGTVSKGKKIKYRISNE